MYGKAKMSKVNDARYATFREKYAPKIISEPLKKLKSADAAQFPPSYPALREKVKQTNYEVNAHTPVPSFGLQPTLSGWAM